MFKNKKIKVEFVFDTKDKDLQPIDEIKPKPSKQFLPQWWKSVPKEHGEALTVKACPAFPDYFSQGYIIPAWQDMKLRYDRETNKYEYTTASKFFEQVDVHSNPQFLDHVDVNVQGKKTNFVFKLNSPWKIITPKGYSTLVLPLFYHFDNDFSSMPGVLDSDIFHEVNVQVLYHGDGEDIFIKRGTPLVMYVPFERKKYDHEVRIATKQDVVKFNTSFMKLRSRFRGSGSYRQMQRDRDSGKE